MPYTMDYLKILLEVVLLLLAFQTLQETVARPTVNYLDMKNDPGTAVDLHNECLLVTTKIVPEFMLGSVDSKTGQFSLTAVYSPGVKSSEKPAEKTVAVAKDAAKSAGQPKQAEKSAAKEVEPVASEENNQQHSVVVVNQNNDTREESGADGKPKTKREEENSALSSPNKGVEDDAKDVPKPETNSERPQSTTEEISNKKPEIINGSDEKPTKGKEESLLSSKVDTTSVVSSPNKGVEVSEVRGPVDAKDGTPPETLHENPETSATNKSGNNEDKSQAEIAKSDSNHVAEAVLSVHTEQTLGSASDVAESVDDKRTANIEPPSASPTMEDNAGVVAAPITTAAVDTKPSQQSEIPKNTAVAAESTSKEADKVSGTSDEAQSIKSESVVRSSQAPDNPEVVESIAKTVEELYTPGTEPV